MREVAILGVPTDFGANRRGVDMGPSAIRYAGLYKRFNKASISWEDYGDVKIPLEATAGSRVGGDNESGPHQLEATAETCERLSDRVDELIDDDHVPLVLGGDHSIGIGTAVGSARHGPLGMIWFDAHGDFNTPKTSPSGNIHGMALAGILGKGEIGSHSWANAGHIDESRVALVGVRDLDPPEKRALRKSEISVYTMNDIDRHGMHAVVQEAVEVAITDVDQIHVSFDLDVLDPREAPGVGTPVKGGLTYREAHSAMEYLNKALPSRSIRSFEMVEVNPILDDTNHTGELACELASSVFGELAF